MSLVILARFENKLMVEIFADDVLSLCGLFIYWKLSLQTVFKKLSDFSCELV